MLKGHPIAIGLARRLLGVSSINEENDMVVRHYR